MLYLLTFEQPCMFVWFARICNTCKDINNMSFHHLWLDFFNMLCYYIIFNSIFFIPNLSLCVLDINLFWLHLILYYEYYAFMLFTTSKWITFVKVIFFKLIFFKKVKSLFEPNVFKCDIKMNFINFNSFCFLIINFLLIQPNFEKEWCTFDYIKFLGFLGKNDMHSLLAMFDFVVDELACLCWAVCIDGQQHEVCVSKMLSPWFSLVCWPCLGRQGYCV